jgi:hypothetical protein
MLTNTVVRIKRTCIEIELHQKRTTSNGFDWKHSTRFASSSCETQNLLLDFELVKNFKLVVAPIVALISTIHIYPVADYEHLVITDHGLIENEPMHPRGSFSKISY